MDMREEIELQEFDVTEEEKRLAKVVPSTIAWPFVEKLLCRERQLLASLAANCEKDAEIALLRSEADENARIIGMSGSREAKLLAELSSLRTSVGEKRIFTSWARAHIPSRPDFIGVRMLENGQREFLTRNEGLCHPYYLTLEGTRLPAPPTEKES